MKKIDVTVIGELNVDFILNEIGSFPAIGKEIISKRMNLTLGSSSAIFSSNLSSLGAKVAFLGKIGKDVFGDMVLQTLRNNNVDINSIIQDDDLNTGATVVLNFGEDRAMVTHPGAMEYLSIDDIDWETIKQSGHLHLSSFFMQKALRNDVGWLFSQAKKEGLTTSFDPQWDPSEKWEIELEHILPSVDIFLPNEKELLHLTKKKSLQEGIDHIKGFAHIIVVKRGNMGSALFYNGKSIFQPSFFNPNVIDAIGAGDSFNAGFIYRFIQNQPLEICQKFGNLIGALSTTAAGGTAAFDDKQNILNNAKERFGYEEN